MDRIGLRLNINFLRMIEACIFETVLFFNRTNNDLSPVKYLRIRNKDNIIKHDLFTISV